MKKIIPKVSKNFLMILAGYFWLSVGLLLEYRAYQWLYSAEDINIFSRLFLGIAGGLLIHHFGFLKIVDKNIKRINLLDKREIFTSFIHLKSYLIAFFMMTFGLFLRNSSIPKQSLAVMYIAIGSALILSSIRYFRFCVVSWINDKKES